MGINIIQFDMKSKDKFVIYNNSFMIYTKILSKSNPVLPARPNKTNQAFRKQLISGRSGGNPNYSQKTFRQPVMRILGEKFG
jgi:hypothetical protein